MGTTAKLLGTTLALLAAASTTPAGTRGVGPGLRCWGPPPGARPVGDPDDRRFEVRDELPGPPTGRPGGPDRAGTGGPHAPLIAPDRPFSGTVWVPLAQPAEADRFVLRSVPDHRVVTTPAGVFGLTVAPLRAVRAGTREDGLLACLDFDPAGRGEPAYPLPDVLVSARDAGLLSARQRDTLAELDRVVAARWRRLAEAWAEFTESPYLVHSRRSLFDLLLAFHDPRPVATEEDLAPERFFDRAQRVRLRSRGHEIPGRCSLGVGAHRVGSYQAKVELEACPRSQLARAWNHLARQRGGPQLQAAAEAAGDEVDSLRLEAVGLTEAAAWELVFSTLAGLPGVAPAAGP